MLPCLKPAPSTNNHISISSPTSQGCSADNTPTSSVPLSPTVNLSREFTLAVKTNSYNEIRKTFDQIANTEQVEFHEETQLLDKVLKPGPARILEAISLTRRTSLTHLIATYFEHTEQTSRLCLLLYNNIHLARLLYTPIHNLLEDLEEYSLSDSQCKIAYNVFLQFDSHLENPFISPNSRSFDDIRRCFLQLREKLDRRLKKSKSKSTRPALCFVAGPTWARSKRDRARKAQLEAAAKGVYVIRNDVDTIDRLVARLHAGVENDRLLVRMGVERGVDRYPIEEILKQLRRNRAGFLKQLVDLEEHLFLCFAAVNRSRSILLQEMSASH
ncbi:hypothetical protein ACP275_10G085500 [Erythranthe tilingii]